MTRDDLFKLYKKLYFHEIEAREKLNSRLQLPLTIIVAQIGLVAYVVNASKIPDDSLICRLYVILLVVTLVALVFAIYFFVRSWFNYTYSFLPVARETENYRTLLQETYDGYEEKDKLIQDALFDYLYNAYIESSSKNAQNNDTRSIFLHKTSAALILSFVLSLTSVLLFHFGGLDSQKNVVQKVLVTTPIEIKNNQPRQLDETRDHRTRQLEKGGIYEHR
jgi:hypothetical protein